MGDAAPDDAQDDLRRTVEMELDRQAEQAAVEARRLLDELVAARHRHAGERTAWAQERTALLHQLATGTASEAALSQQVHDIAADYRTLHGQLADAAPAWDGGARLQAHLAARHAADVSRAQGGEQAALAHVKVLTGQVHELRAEITRLQADEASARMAGELVSAQLRSELAAMQDAAARRAAAARRTAEQELARQHQRVVDVELMQKDAVGPGGTPPGSGCTGSASPEFVSSSPETLASETPSPETLSPRTESLEIVPPEWSAPAAPHRPVPVQDVLPAAEEARSRRFAGYWRR